MMWMGGWMVRHDRLEGETGELRRHRGRRHEGDASWTLDTGHGQPSKAETANEGHNQGDDEGDANARMGTLRHDGERERGELT